MNRIKVKIITVMLLLCVCTVWFARNEIIESNNGTSGESKISDTFADEPAKLYARSAVLMDADSGRVLFGKEDKVMRPMASTTKIMTCILALENMTRDQVVTASDYAAGQPKVHLGVISGQQFYLSDILYSLMLESHNDSAVMVAEAIAGNVEAFARMMNDKARQLGLENTHFVTPNGLDGEDAGGIHATTARELAAIMKYCIMDSPKKEQFLEITGAKEHAFCDIEGKVSYSCYNHNAFLNMMDGAISGKTGFTADAGYCYVGAVRREDRTFIVALLACGWPNHKEYKWSDTKKLMEYGIENFYYQNVWKPVPNQEILVKDSGSSRDIYRKNEVVEAGILHAPEELRVLMKRGEKADLVIRVKKTLTAPVKKGQKVGELVYTLGENELAKYEIITLSEVQKRTFFWCLKRCVKQFLFVKLH